MTLNGDILDGEINLGDLHGTLVCGRQVQQDMSGGQGHCWRNVDADDIPATALEEIVAEIVDGNTECDDYAACNGQHYRWW